MFILIKYRSSNSNILTIKNTIILQLTIHFTSKFILHTLHENISYTILMFQ